MADTAQLLEGWSLIIRTPDERTALVVEMLDTEQAMGFRMGDTLTSEEQHALVVLLVALGFDVDCEDPE